MNTIEERPRAARRGRLGAAILVFVLTLVSCGSDADDLGSAAERLPADPQAIVDAAADAVGEVQTVRFELVATGAPTHIDSADTLAFEGVVGRFAAPDSADAVLDVKVLGSLSTQLGAVSIGGRAWLTNPITGKFEDLPEDYNVDPVDFFDPVGGWRPLLEGLTDIVLVGEEDHNGLNTYHLTAVGAAAQIEVVTAGIVDGEDLPLDIWIDPTTALVAGVEFTTDGDQGTTEWVVTLSEYGSDIVIEPPPEDG